MSTAKYYFASVAIGLCLRTAIAATPEGCNRKLCPGPLYYYEELGCSPIFNSTTSCCPTRYSCDNWKNLPEDKCLVNGHVYGIGEELRSHALRDPCYRCICSGDGFWCLTPQCAGPRMRRPGCTYKYSMFHCCSFVEICQDSPVTCIVDGKSYKTGETFHPLAEPEKTCVCSEGYTGVNSDQLCVWKKPSWCGNVVFDAQAIHDRCAPLYGKDSSPQTDCNRNFACAQDEDYIIKGPHDNHHETAVDSQKDSENHCVLGNATIRIGDEYRGSRFYDGPIRCMCEVPPVPTCHYLT